MSLATSGIISSLIETDFLGGGFGWATLLLTGGVLVELGTKNTKS